MTLAAIIAKHSAKSATPRRKGVARCGAQTVGTPSATPATPATPKKQTPELRAQQPSDTVQPDAFAETLKAERTRLLTLAAAEWIDAAHVHRLHDADLAGWIAAGLHDGQRRAFLHLLDDNASRHAGRVPLDDTAAMFCQHCGPVWTHPDIAAVLPVVDGWPRALGCPWCFVRKAGGYIPRPSVTCGDCQHFTPDTINPPAGMGTCNSGHGMHYPMKAHRCAAYLSSTETGDLA
ncbi:MAG: hypothetical protein ABI268_12100 [Rhodanobacter sp.]